MPPPDVSEGRSPTWPRGRVTVAMVVYLVAGALGLPVFAGGEGGVAVLLGPTGGYLADFWFAAALMGYAPDHGALRGPRAPSARRSART